MDQNRFCAFGQNPEIPGHLVNGNGNIGISFGSFRAEGALVPVASTGCAIGKDQPGRQVVERLVGAGGMPSSHTALVVSLAAGIALREGLDSDLFAVAVVLAGIVMYDAAGVRRAAGKQAKVINKLVREMRVEHKVRDTRLKELLGHTPLEVLGGAVHGILVAYAFYLFYR